MPSEGNTGCENSNHTLKPHATLPRRPNSYACRHPALSVCPYRHVFKPGHVFVAKELQTRRKVVRKFQKELICLSLLFQGVRISSWYLCHNTCARPTAHVPFSWRKTTFKTAVLIYKLTVGQMVRNLSDLIKPEYSLKYALRKLEACTQDRGFAPGQSLRIFYGERILSTPSFGGEVKASAPVRSFTACKRSLNVTWTSAFRQN
jgi:hypothetical protein